jgi:hypothetical protein
MAYGMRPEELAAVGRSVNNQGSGVSEESIQTAMDAELEEERKGAVARQKKRTSSARIKTAQNKADMRNAIIQSVADISLKAAKAAGSKTGDTDSGGVPGGGGPSGGATGEGVKSSPANSPRVERVAARAETAGERGNVVRQAKLQDRSAMLKGKEDIRADAQQTKLNQKLANQKAKAAKRAADPKMQRRLDKYKLKQAYGGDRKVSSYTKPGSLYGRKQPSAVSYSVGEQQGDIMGSAGGTRRGLTNDSELDKLTRTLQHEHSLKNGT